MKFKWYEIGYIILGAVCIFYYAIKLPSYDYDMPPYVAAIYKSQGFNKEQTYKKTFNELSKINKPVLFNADRCSLNTALSYEENIAKKDAIEYLWQWTSYVSIRFLHIELIKIIHKLNIPYYFSIFILNAFFVAMFFIIYCLIAKKINISIFFSFFLVYTGIITTGRHPAPDALACFMLLLIVLMYLSNYLLISFIFASLLPLARTDYAIFSVLFSLLNYSKYKNIALIPLVAIPLVFIINKLGGNLGYLQLFNATFIDNHKSLPLDVIISSKPIDYIKVYLKGIKHIIAFPMTAVIFYLYLLSLKIVGFDKTNKQDSIQLCVILTLACHFLLFPFGLSRHYFGFYSIIMLISLAKIHNKIGSLNIVELYKNAFTKVTTK